MQLKLFSFFRSSASHRVRIALHLKGVEFATHHVSLDKGEGEQFSSWYRAVNPQERVPALVVEENGRREIVTQSLAIIEWLDETFRSPALLPTDPIARAHNRAVANIVNADMHPIMNMRVRNFLKNELKMGRDDVDRRFYARWINDGFGTIEAMIPGGPFAFGDTPSLADIFIVPQMANARRFDMDLSSYPKLLAIERSAERNDAFERAAPHNQPDYVTERARS